MQNDNIVKISPYDFIDYRKCVNTLCSRYPFLNKLAIGKSVLGKEIFALSLGESREEVLYAGAFHGSEHITSVLLLLFIENLCNALEKSEKIGDIDARRAFYNCKLTIVPLVNPDGCEISQRGLVGAGKFSEKVSNWCKDDIHKWNSNVRGVDINHNFNAGFDLLKKLETEAGTHQPGPTRYGGEKPESEPETFALADYCRNNYIRHLLAFHSQGEEIYYKYNGNIPLRSKKMASIFSASSGYKLAEPENIASHGGFKDWFISEFSRPGFTVEVGKGENPLSYRKLPGIYVKLEEMLMLGLLM